MRVIIEKLFVFLSYGVLKGIGVRLRTQLIFMQVVFLLIMMIEFTLFRLFRISSKTGALVLFASLPLPWLISRFVDSYVNNNWRLFNPRNKEKVENLWLYRVLVYLVLLALLIGMSFSGYLWAKGNVEHQGY